MREHHRRALERLVNHFQSDPAFPALLVAGSIARGWDKEDSDVDVILIATDEEYARRAPTRAFHYFTTEFCDYPGGYVDGKIADMGFLREVAQSGSEPARAAFSGAIIGYSRLPDLDELLRQIPVYPEGQRRARMLSFYAQVQALAWYVGEAEKRGDRYLLQKMSADLVLFAGRLILAHNRILYPYHKWLVTELARAPDKPADMLALADQLLSAPSKHLAEQFSQCVLNFTEWEKPAEGWPARFMEDTEWAWRRGCAPLADC
jgi:hypothetical protein